MGEKAGKNIEHVQQSNRTLILELLKRNGTVARSELARQSGLRQSTITKIVSDFLERGLVCETGFLEGKKGRRSIALTLNPDHYVAAVRVSREYLMTGVLNVCGQEIGSPVLTDIHGLEPEQIIRRIVGAVRALEQRWSTQLCAVGVAVPGPYIRSEKESGPVTGSPGWAGVSLERELRKQIRLPIVVEHDANAGILAELAEIHPVDPAESLIYIAVGQGIGAGVYTGGRLMQGTHGIAGEIGHTCIDIHGPKCECGSRGCLTHYVSTPAFMLYAEEERPRHSGTQLQTGFSRGELFSALAAGDPAAAAAFERILDYLAVGLINVIYSYDPDTVILGDEMAQAGERMIAGLRRRLSVLRPAILADHVKLRLAVHQPDPAYAGAAAAAAQFLFSNTGLLDAPKDPVGQAS